MNKTKLPSVVPILVLTLITVVLWVSLEIFKAFNKPSDTIVSSDISQPLTPTLDQNSINQIEARIFLDDSQIPDTVVNSQLTPSAQVTPSPIAITNATSTTQPVIASGSGMPL
jgi:hypothetical protein